MKRPYATGFLETDSGFETEWEGFETKSDEAWQGEVNRKSKEYIRWVQSSLNRILGLRLAVDGDLGSQTRSAIRSFQQQKGLTADGIVGSRTEAAIQAALRTSSPQTTSGVSTSGSASTCSGLRQPTVLDQFDFDSSRIIPSHQAQINAIAQCVVASQSTSQPIRTIRLVGHTDPVGSATYNLDLGRRRAEQIKQSLQESINRLRSGLATRITFQVETRGEKQPISGSAARSRRVEVFLSAATTSVTLPALTPAEQAEFNRLNQTAQNQFRQLRAIIATYTGIARTESDRGSRALLRYGYFRQLSQLLPEILRLTQISVLPGSWRLSVARPLLVGNVLYNLAFPETINQGGTDRLGGRPDPTCFSASTQILLAHRFPATYVRLTIELATTNRATFAGGDNIGPLTFASTSLYKSLDSVLLQTAFDRYFKTKTRHGAYAPGDELKVHRQVFGVNRPPRFATYGTKASMISAFRKAFITGGGNTRRWEIINLCVGNPSPSCSGNHTVVLTRATGGRVYFYNPWANEEEKNMMWGSAQVSVSGHGERPAESSMTQADFENQLTTVFHN